MRPVLPFTCLTLAAVLTSIAEKANAASDLPAWVYEPPSESGPILQGVGDTTASASFGSNGITVEGAHAFARWLGIIGGGSYWPRARHDEQPLLEQDQPVPRYGHSHTYGEIGVGPLFRPEPNSKWRIELFAGVGYGQSTGQIEIPQSTHVMDITGSYILPFVQADVGRIANEVVEYAFAGRLVDMNYHFHSVDGAPADAHRFVPLLQLAFLLRLGWRNFKGELQIGIDSPNTTSSVPYAVSSAPGYASIGIFYRFGGPTPNWSTHAR